MNRRPSRFSTCPPCQIPEDSRPAQARKIGRKSLAPKVLPARLMGSRFCGRSSVFSIIYRQAGGRGYTSFARGEVCSLGKEPCAVPEGTRVSLLAYPALKRWAKLFRAYGARFSALLLDTRIRESVLLAGALKRWAILFRPLGARVTPESCELPNWADRCQCGKDVSGRWSSTPTREKALRFGDPGEGQIYPNPNVGLARDGGRSS